MEYAPPAETTIIQRHVEAATPALDGGDEAAKPKPLGGIGKLAGSGSGLKSALLSKLGGKLT